MDKRSFLIYLDYKEQFELLTDEELGQLIRAIMEYEETQQVSELKGSVKMAFSFIKQQLDRDKEKWIEEKKKRSQAGRRGMANRWGNSDSDNDIIENDDKDNTVMTDNNKNNTVIKLDNKNNNVKSVITRNNKNN